MDNKGGLRWEARILLGKPVVNRRLTGLQNLVMMLLRRL